MDTIKKSDIPEELRDLDTIILENFLCWYAQEYYKKKLIAA